MKIVRTKSYKGWAVRGSISWILYGTAATVLIVFEPPLTYIPFRHSWTTILITFLFFAVIGSVLGLMGRGKYEDIRFFPKDENIFSITMFMAFWGLIFGAGIMALFFLLPSIDGADLRPIIHRCVAGGIAGFLAGGFTMVLVSGPDRDQLSESGVRRMIEHLPKVNTEILQFFEPGTSIMYGQEGFVPNVLGEFRDPSIGMIYGEGVGHVFIRVSAVLAVAYRLESYGLNWHGLVKALESSGYHVKHIHYFACETREKGTGSF